MGELSPAPAGSPVIAIRVTVRAPDLEAFIERYSQHIDGDRIFIFTKNPQPVGTRVRFTLQLANGEQLIHGNGTVTRVQEDAGDRRHPPGMELVFVPLDDRSQTLVDFLLASRAADAPPLVRAVVPQAPPPLPPEPIGRGDAGGIETEAATSRVSVEVKSTPPGARVLVDGKEHAAPTPMSIEGLEEGKACEVAISLDGYRSWSRKVRPRQGERLVAMLMRIERIVEVSSDPPGAELFLDGRRIGVTPYVVRRLERAKSHEIELRLAGFVEQTRRISPTDRFEARDDGEVLRLELKLEPEGAQPVEPLPTTPESDSGVIAVKLAEHLPAAVSEIASGPAPSFVEKWREPQSPLPDGNVPANPFSEVSDGAIEYFVEWSLEQSIGPRVDHTSTFSNVAMELPGQSAEAPAPQLATPEPRPAAASAIAPARMQWWLVAAGFAAGLVCGVVPMALWRRPPPPAPVVAREMPSPSPVAAASPAPAEEVELRIVTQPPRASLVIDGKAAGVSPLVARLPAGKHEVVASKERYQIFKASTDAPGELSLTLERPPAILHVVSKPAGAHISIRGTPRGDTPADIKLHAFETYEVMLQLNGGKPWRKSVYLRPPSTNLEATLAPAKTKHP